MERTNTSNSSRASYHVYPGISMQGGGIIADLIEKPELKTFLLKQNFPNPFTKQTVIPFTLPETCDVRISLYDLQGRKAAELEKCNMTAGDHNILVDFAAIGIGSGDYLYYVEVKGASGTSSGSRIMTAAR